MLVVYICGVCGGLCSMCLVCYSYGGWGVIYLCVGGWFMLCVWGVLYMHWMGCYI